MSSSNEIISALSIKQHIKFNQTYYMKRKAFFIVSILSIILSACDKDFEEINTDPTKLTPQNMQYNYLFTSAIMDIAGNTDGYSAGIWESSLSYASTMMQQLSSTSAYWYGDKYVFNEVYTSAFWRTQYPTSIKNIVDVMENVKDDETRRDLYNICRILKVFSFQRITDLYGDVPYFEAGLGYINSTTHPKYDLQQDIYADMLKELDEAATALGTVTNNSVADADVLYGGDVDKWKKFAYSEMLRLAMRMSKIDTDKAKTWAQKAIEGGVMQSNEDNAICPHEAKGTSPVSNPVGLQFASREPGSYRISETFMNFLRWNKDPRLQFLATISADPTDGADLGNTDTAIQLGQPNGYDASGAVHDITKAANWPGDQNKYSVVNRSTFAREDAPTFLLTYAETSLLLAEAAQRGWVGSDASAYYEDGVVAAILQLNQAGADIAASDAQDYIDAHPYNSANGLEMINTQYWAATFADWNETWCNWRRSGYPALQPVNYPGNSTNGTIPRRFSYPLDEANVNPQNYLEAVSRIEGGDEITSRVWWDK